MFRAAEAHIQGQTNFGDNVEDEWFIVFLLKQLTKHDPDLVVTVEDSDGQFLLIEAADSLPKWLTPESAVNRVFVYRSRLHLIPKRKDPLPHGVPALPEAIRVLRSSHYETKAPREMQTAIESRIRGFPDEIRKNQHFCHCYVPAAVAAVLDSDPYLISAAVRAFFYKDPIDLKACRVMKHFPPENRVMRNVKMTRCLYAQLMSQQHTPDPKIGWEIPSPGSRQYKSYDLGMKIACGFEILAVTAEGNASPNDEDDTICLIDNPQLLDQDKRWRKYIRSLYANGYFEGLVKGSKAYTGRVDKARNYFCNAVVPSTCAHIDLASYTYLGKKILHSVQTLDIDYERYRKQESQLPPEDSDKWMSVEPDDFDEFLKEKFLNPSNSQLSKLSDSVPKAISEFVAMNSGLQGVEIAANSPSGKKGKGLPKERTVSPTPTEGFDPECFANALRNVLTLKVPSDPEFSDSDMSDYSDEMGSESDIDSDERPDELDFLKNQRNRQNMKSKKDSDDIVSDMKSYMKEMDKELSGTTIGQSFDKRPPLASVEDDDEDDDAVDIGYNALKNMLESYKNQDGMPGPSTTLLNSMGVFLPKDTDRFASQMKH